MSDDIVTRLRDSILRDDEDHISGLPDEAADEIKRLRVENARLREALTQIEKWTAEMTNNKTSYVGTMIRNKARAALGEEKKG
jgi:hypothetical protein